MRKRSLLQDPPGVSPDLPKRAPRLRHPVAAAVLVVALAAVLPYLGTLGHGFALDDAPEVVRNAYIRSLRHVPAIFAGGAWEGANQDAAIYRPLTTVTYALDHATGGLSPARFHATNVALHALVSILVLALGLRVGLPLLASGAGAVLFAIHPIHVEVVANVAGRKDALATAFVILALLAHAAALERRARRWSLLPPAVFAAALLSKESGIAALGAFVAWDLLLGREARARRQGRALALYAAYAAVTLGYLWARQRAVGSLGFPLESIPYVENPLPHLDTVTRLLTSVAVLGRGLALLVWPGTLSPDYSFDAIPAVETPLDARVLASAAAIVAIAWGALWSWRRAPVITFAALWYGAAIFPASNLLVPIGTIFGERVLYLPSVAFCLAAAVLAVRLLAARRDVVRVAAVGAAVVAIALVWRTVAYAAVWSDEVSLFTAAVRAAPRSSKAHGLLGAALMEAGRAPEGVQALEAAVRRLEPLASPPPRPFVELGVAYEQLARLADAEAIYAEILRRIPEHADALWRLGVVRWRQGNPDEAARLWERTLAASPGHAPAMTDLGILRYQRGDLAGAEALWARASLVDPLAAGPWLHLGNLHERQGDLARARSAWREFLARARYGVHPGERERILRKLGAIEASERRGRADRERGEAARPGRSAP